MKDSFGREISYLRVSVTDLCNLRCRYCMPEEGVCKLKHEEILTEDELLMLIRAAASLGFRKIRFTGGEPLVKKNIVRICERTAAVPGIREICLTTNATLLWDKAEPLAKAGVSRVNISLDTLNPEKYAYITRGGKLEDALRGLEAGIRAGFRKIKINAVLMDGFNDDEIGALAALTQRYPVDVRFIEQMPMLPAAGVSSCGGYLSADAVLKALEKAGAERTDEQVPGAETAERGGPGARTAQDGSGIDTAQDGSGIDTAQTGQGIDTAQTGPEIDELGERLRLPGACGCIGLLRTVSRPFCGSCSRMRLTADGRLRPCLHLPAEYPVKGFGEEEMRQQLIRAILAKPACRGSFENGALSAAGRTMNTIGG